MFQRHFKTAISLLQTANSPLATIPMPSFSLPCAVLAAVLCASDPSLVQALTDPATPPAEPLPVPTSAPVTDIDATLKAKTPGLNAAEVYAILAGEIAGRRGEMGVAFSHYLKAAQLTRSSKLAELAVRTAISSKDYPSAEQGVRLWLELAPDAPAAHQLAALLRLESDDREGALIHLVRFVELTEGTDASVYGKVASIIERAPNPERRLPLMQALVEHFPQSADAQQALAILAASASRFEIATAAARRALELRPNWDQPRTFLVKLLLAQDKRDEARQMLETFVGQNPDDQSLRMLYGQFLVEEQAFSDAREVFEHILIQHPDAPDVLFAVGVLSLQLNDPNSARIYFTRLYDTGERKDEAAFYLGQAAERAQDVHAALTWYEKVTDFKFSDAQVRIAFLRAKSGEVKRAREILQQLRGSSPEDAVALYLIEAEILNEVGQADEATAVFNTALEIYPDDSGLLYARALHAVERGQLTLAEKDFTRLIAADPGNADALNALGYTLADRTDRYGEAKTYIEKAYAIKPDEPAILDSMGWVNYRLGDYDAALGYLRRALDKLDDGEIAAHLGEVLWTMGRQTDAWKVWDAALQTHPGHAYLQEVTARHRALKTETQPESGSQHTKPGQASPPDTKPQQSTVKP